VLNLVDFSLQDYENWMRRNTSAPDAAIQAFLSGIQNPASGGFFDSPDRLEMTSMYTVYGLGAEAKMLKAVTQTALSEAKTAQQFVSVAVATGQNLAIPEKLQAPLIAAANQRVAQLAAVPVAKVKTLQERVAEVENREFDSEEALWDFLYLTFSAAELSSLGVL